ncbi:MAG: RnfABCDGE type electron transport complex subunit D [Clostridia bacterium]|nr:RnfABCDGE type electron transport complex subunit D [Clostridia bacterium]
MGKALNLSAGPHVRDRWTTPFIMMVVFLSLLPAAIVGVVVHWVKFQSLNALWVILASIGSAVLTELLFCLATRRKITIGDGSAAVTGLLLALCLSPNTPVLMPVIGSVFAILVVKCCFGGLGKNFINPALAARCFLLISFSSFMSNNYPSFDAVTSATPVEMLYTGQMVDITRMFLGTAGGVIGSSILALLIGGLVLWGLDIIHGEICFSVIGAFTLVLALFGGHGFDISYLVAQLCGGGVILGAFFMATDYTTSPVSRLGQLVYGCLIGVLGALFRIYGKGTDMFSYSIIIANLFTPLIDLYIIPKPFAYRKRAIEKAAGVVKPPFFKRIPKPVIALTLIAAVAGLALSGVYTVTKDPIAVNELAKKQEAYRIVCEDADANPPFIQIESDLYGTKYGGKESGDSVIEEALEGRNAAGETVGYVIVVRNNEAYNGSLRIAIGIKPDGTINRIAFVEINETPGKGSIWNEDANYRDQFNGRRIDDFFVLKGNRSTNGVDAVGGATVTSNAVVNAVNAGLAFFRNEIMRGGK